MHAMFFLFPKQGMVQSQHQSNRRNKSTRRRIAPGEIERRFERGLRGACEHGKILSPRPRRLL